MSEDTELKDMIQADLEKENIEWYDMIRCNVKVDGQKTQVRLPAGFLKQIGLLNEKTINDEEYMLSKFMNEDSAEISIEENMGGVKYIYESKLAICLPQDNDNFNNEVDNFEKFFSDVVPKRLHNRGFYENIFCVTRLVSYACVLSYETGKDIFGLKKMFNYISSKNDVTYWEKNNEMRKYSSRFREIEKAFLSEGKIIAPLQGQGCYTGWKIISMIYTMLWCNYIKIDNRKEILGLIKILTIIDRSAEIMSPTLWSDYEEVTKSMKKEVCGRKFSAAAWCILFLYIRNYKWFYEYISEILSVYDFSDFIPESLKRLEDITEGWKLKKDNDFIEAIKNLDEKDFAWIAEILLGPGDRKNSSKERYNTIRSIKEKFKRLNKLFKSSFIRYFLLQPSYRKFSSINIGFYLCINMMLYHRIEKIGIPPCNRLDFVRKSEPLGSYSREKKSGKSKSESVIKLSKGVRETNKQLDKIAWDNYSMFENLYLAMLNPIVSATKIYRDTEYVVRSQKFMFTWTAENFGAFLQLMREEQ